MTKCYNQINVFIEVTSKTSQVCIYTLYNRWIKLDCKLYSSLYVY